MHSNEVVDLQKFRSADTAKAPAEDNAAHYLRAGTTLLVGQYIIDGYLNCGGFGITYTARDSLGRKVVIKECFPGEMVYRDGKAMKTRSPKYKKELASIVRNFVTEAHSLANVKHPNIVHVHQIFEENGTAYLAMDFIDGPDLLDMLESDRKLTPAQVEALTRRILDAIRYLHRTGMLHRDVSPDNILVQRDGAPVLIDFGAARHVSPEECEAAPRMKFVKDGYSPQEFYVAGGRQGPFSDLYAIAATIHHVITGAAPVDAQTRVAARAAKKPDPYKPLADRVTGYSPRFLKAIDRALALMPEERLQTAQEWLDRIGPEPSAPAAGLFKPVTAVLESLSIFDEAKRGETPGPAGRPGLRLAAGVAIAALTLGGAFYAIHPGNTSDGTLSVALPVETTPPELRIVANLPQPEPLVSVWPDGFAALVTGPATDVEVARGVASEITDPEISIADLGTVPRVAVPDISRVGTRFVPPAMVESVASMPRPDAMLALDLPRLSLAPSVPDMPRPPQKAPLAEFDMAGANQLGAAPLDVTLQSIAPVALVDRAAPLPEIERAPRLSVDTRAPAYVPRPTGSAQAASFSTWEIDLPFAARPPRVGEGNVLVITEIDPEADLVLAGEWITEGLILVGVDGAPLREGVSLKDQILDNVTITNEGTAQVSVFYRAPRAEVLDEAVLTLPVLRRTGLADGTVLETRKQGASWITTVAELGRGQTDLEVGDMIIGNATSPTRFTDPDAVEAAFEALIQSDLTAAEFSILRAGQRQTAAWRLDPKVPRATDAVRDFNMD